LDSEEFYNICQAYRNAPIADQLVVSAKFEVLKASIIVKIAGVL
jgi:hypothetical protein